MRFTIDILAVLCYFFSREEEIEQNRKVIGVDRFLLPRYELSPSLICMNLVRLEEEVHRLEEVGCKVLHVDVLDGHFAPSMPIGLDTIRQLRKTTDMIFDVHVMTTDNPFYVRELIDMGCERICFHLETQRAPEPLLHEIRLAGCEAGLALSPGTPLSQMEYLLEEIDRVLLMRISPGYAHLPGQDVKPYMERKVKQLRRMIDERNLDVSICMDGHIGFDDVKPLVDAGATTLVCGTRCLIRKDSTLQENWAKLHALLSTNA